jgi:hypothetical protein
MPSTCPYMSMPLTLRSDFRPKRTQSEHCATVLGYRLYRDLKRGWRVTSPNLEQAGLLEIGYLALDEVCEAQDLWENRQPCWYRPRPKCA